MKSSDPVRFYVYAHYTEDSGRLFYVGKGSGNRAWAIYGRNKKWRSVYSKHGRVVVILECGLTEEMAFSIEEDYISSFGIENLATFTVGGSGTAGYIHSDTTKKKMSLAHKGRNLSEEAKNKLKKTINSSKELIEYRRCQFLINNPMNKDENRKTHSVRMTLNNPMSNQNTIEKMRKSKLGGRQSEETKRKRSAALKGKPWSAARREAQERKSP